MAKTAAKPMKLALPQALRKYVEAQAESPEDYLARLVREDRDRKRDALEAHLMKALEGESIPITEAELNSGESILAILDRKMAARKNSRKNSAA